LTNLKPKKEEKMKLNIFVVCLLALVVFTASATAEVDRKEVVVIQEGDNVIYPLGDKYHIFRDGKLEASLQRNKEGHLLALHGNKVDLSIETLWDLIFKKERTFEFTLKTPRIGWRWHFFPIENLGTYKAEEIYYSQKAKNIIVKEAPNTVTGNPQDESQINIGAIYAVSLLMFFVAGLFHTARIFPNKNTQDANEKLWSPNNFYIGLFGYLALMWICFQGMGFNGLFTLFFVSSWIILCIVALKITNELLAVVFAALLILFLNVSMVSFFCPTHDFEFFTQYLSFLAVLAFIAHFSTKTLLEKVKEKKEDNSRQIEEAYSK
jgi:hypothetical protein